MTQSRKELLSIGYHNMGPYVAPQMPTDTELGILDDIVPRKPLRSASKLAIALCAIERRGKTQANKHSPKA